MQVNVDQALSLIRTIPDYPKQGILFQDITPVLSNPDAFNVVVRALAEVDPESSVVAGIEARGFIFASAIAVAKGCGFVPIRKGTLVAAIELVQQAGGIVTDIAVLSEISFLGGRLRIAEHSPSISIHALISG